MFFQETSNRIHKIQVKVDIGESRVAEIGGRKSGFTIVKKESNSTFERQCFFLVFFGRHGVRLAKRRSKSTLGSAMFRNPLVFCYFENRKVKLENEKVQKCLMKLMFFGATAICICKRQYKVEKGGRRKMGHGLGSQRFTEIIWRFY